MSPGGLNVILQQFESGKKDPICLSPTMASPVIPATIVTPVTSVTIMAPVGSSDLRDPVTSKNPPAPAVKNVTRDYTPLEIGLISVISIGLFLTGIWLVSFKFEI